MGSNGHIANPEALVSTDWAAEHQNDPGVRVVEVDVDTTAYSKGHLPSAVGWDWRNDLQAKPVRDLAPQDKLEELLSRSGIEPSTTMLMRSCATANPPAVTS